MVFGLGDAGGFAANASVSMDKIHGLIVEDSVLLMLECIIH